MIKFSSSLKLNEIHTVDSPFNEGPKNIFSREVLFSGEGRLENLGKMGNNRDIYWYANRGGGEFRKTISAPPPWYQNPCDVSIFLHARPNFRKKMKKGQSSTFLYCHSLPKYKDVFKIFLYGQTPLVID